jgi:hypothetical protein
MNAAWQAFMDEIARWRDAGRKVEFWWRDDDAARPHPALARLLDLAGRARVPLAIAAIPLEADAAAFTGLGAEVALLQHGTDHRNRAAAAEKKTEFPPSASPDDAVARLVAARERLAGLAPERFVPVLAPPWNRIPAAFAPALAAAGYTGLSQFGARAAARPAQGLVQVNTHVDLIDWRGGRGFGGEAAVLAAAVRHLAAKRAGRADAGEATGWLSHHLVHDEPAWTFLERLFETLGPMPGIRWQQAATLFPGP